MSKISSGFIWSGIERFSIQGISFILSIIIARIVSPSAYGLIVMIQVFLSFSQLFIDGGFANALIQKKDRKEIDYYTVFIFNLLVALFLYLVFFLVAPLIANFYEEPQLKVITRVISLNLIFSSLSIVQKARLTINLDFKTQTRAGLLSVIVGGAIGVICAYSGLEVWALVIQGLVGQIVTSIALMYYSRWKPQLQFSRESFRSLFSYGSKLLASNVLTNIYLNLYNLVIGKKYSSADLAFYNRGYTLSLFPSVNIVDVLDRVIFPVLSKLQDEKEELLAAYFKYLRLANYIVLPIMTILIVLADSFIEVVLTQKWLPAVPYLRIFSVTYMFHAWITESINIIAAVGKSGIILKFQIVKRTISLLLFILTITISIEAVCWGILLNSVIELTINLYLDRKVLNISPLTQIKSQFNIVAAVIIMGITVWVVKMLVGIASLQLVIGVLVGLGVYFVLTIMFKMDEVFVYRYVLDSVCSLYRKIARKN